MMTAELNQSRSLPPSSPMQMQMNNAKNTITNSETLPFIRQHTERASKKTTQT